MPEEVGIGGARTDCVNGDAPSAELYCGDSGELLDRTLARGVGGVARGVPNRVRGRDVDDPAAVAHIPGGMAGGEERRLCIDDHRVVPQLFVGVGDRPAYPEVQRGVVDQNVLRIEMLGGHCHQPIHRSGRGEIDLYSVGPAAGVSHGTFNLGRSR
jgi:hypothetical protein